MLLAFAATAAAQDALTKMRAEYSAENNAVKKAKILAKLGPREITAIRNFSKDGEDDKALATLEQYRDAVLATTKALADTGIDAVRHSGGFKELQISLRTSIRRLDDLIFSLQQDIRPAFRAARSELETAESSLIDALFPVRTPRRPTTASSQ
jgi:hypothetical protein